MSDKFEEKLAEIGDVVKAADELLEICRMMDVGVDLAKGIWGDLSTAETCETEEDFDANVKLAYEKLDPLKKVLKASDETGIEDALDAFKTLRREFGEFREVIG